MDRQFRCYIASPNELAEHIKKLLLPELEKRNIYISSKWWEYYRPLRELHDYYLIAYHQFECIRNSDFLILFGDPNHEVSFNGPNIELGFAIALMKKTFSVFKFRKSLMHYIDEPCFDIPELLERIEHFIKIKNEEEQNVQQYF